MLRGDEGIWYLSLIHIWGLSSSDTSLKQNRKQQKLAKQIEELAAKDDLTLKEAYKLSKLMEKNIAESDSTRSCLLYTSIESSAAETHQRSSTMYKSPDTRRGLSCLGMTFIFLIRYHH